LSAAHARRLNTTIHDRLQHPFGGVNHPGCVLRYLSRLVYFFRHLQPLQNQMDAKDEVKEQQEKFFALNPEYENATHAVWFCGLESWESFCQREFPGQKLPLPSFFV
jgi:hypothetical protein